MRRVKLSVIVVINVISILCNNVIDVDDILSIDYMPGSLFLLENAPNYRNDTSALKNDTLDLTGKFNEALSTMGFHRYRLKN